MYELIVIDVFLLCPQAVDEEEVQGTEAGGEGEVDTTHSSLEGKAGHSNRLRRWPLPRHEPRAGMMAACFVSG